MRKLLEPGSIWPQPSKPSRFLRQQHLTKEDWMSSKFLVTINSWCTTVEVALSVDGLLKNVLAHHLLDTLYIFCGNIYRRFEILQNTIIYENTSRNHFLRQGWALYYLLTAAFLMSGMSSSSLNIWNATWNPHKEDPRGCWAHCIEVPKWQVNPVPNR
jgi:hypothetical protein